MPHFQSTQSPSAVVMVRPHHFSLNPQTAADNSFQRTLSSERPEEIARQAFQEVGAVAAALEAQGVEVHLFEDESAGRTPDSVFPNNWFSTHAGGHVAVYPMYSPNRRLERRTDIIEMLKAQYRVQEVIDYSGLEADGLFLEGTGAMVLDHIARIAYTARSNRANAIALERFATQFNFEPMAFDALDPSGQPVYHTNVLMCVATEFALVGLDLIQDPARRDEIRRRLLDSGRDVIELSAEQIAGFAGNAMELSGRSGRILALSARAFDSLLHVQKAIIRRSAKIVPVPIPTLELAGGSVRCMLAGIHLSRR